MNKIADKVKVLEEELEGFIGDAYRRYEELERALDEVSVRGVSQGEAGSGAEATRLYDEYHRLVEDFPYDLREKAEDIGLREFVSGLDDDTMIIAAGDIFGGSPFSHTEVLSSIRSYPGFLYNDWVIGVVVRYPWSISEEYMVADPSMYAECYEKTFKSDVRTRYGNGEYDGDPEFRKKVARYIR